MNPEHGSEADVEQLGELLEAYDAALAAGQPLGQTASAELSTVLRTELESLEECLRRLERARSRRRRTTSGDAATPAPPDATLPAMPARLGRYELRRLLGSGGFGLVYLAWDPQLRREVAVKVPRPEALLTASGRERTLREAQTAAGLDHPHLVPVYEAGEVGPAVYLVSAYCPGPTLEQWLTDHPAPVPIRSAAELLTCLADAVQYMHSRGVLHRDLKPANILLQKSEDQNPKFKTSSDFGFRISDFTPKVTDFGLAKDLQRETRLTQSGAALGTPAYMAPEQAEGRAEDVGPATDVYALGVVLYRLLTGRVPFLGANDLDTVRRIAGEEPLEPRRLRPEVPRDVQTICLKCLEKPPARRYASAGELADDLRRFLRGEPVRARPVGRWQRLIRWARRRPAAAGLIAVSGLALLGTVAGGAFHLVRVDQYNAELEKANSELLKTNVELSATATREQQERGRAEAQAELARHHAYVNQIRFAAEAIDGGRPWQAAEALNRVRPRPGEADPRGLEWFELWRRGRREALYLTGHWDVLATVAFSPDGRMLASGSRDRTAKLWDTATGRLRMTLPEHPKWVPGVAFSPDGRQLATACQDERVRLWDTATGQELGEFVGSNDKWAAVAFSPDGRWLASGGEKTVQLWDLAGRREVRHWAPGWQVFDLSFSADGRRLAGNGDFRAAVWEIPSGREEISFASDPERGPAVAATPDGRTVAITAGSVIYVWDTGAAAPRQTLRGHTEAVNTAAFSRDGKRLASAGMDLTVRLWDVATGQELARFPQPSACPTLAFAPDGLTLAVGNRKPAVVALYNLTRPPPAAAAPPAPSRLRLKAWSVAFAPDGRTLASGSQDLHVTLWDTATGQARAHLPLLWSDVYAVAYAPDGRTVAAGTAAGTVVLHDTTSGSVRATLKGHRDRVTAVAFSPDGRTVASASWDRTVALWDVATGQRRRTLEGHTDYVSGLAFHPDGRTLASGSRDHSARLWDAATGQLQGILWDDERYEVKAVAFAPNGARLATGNAHGSVRLWDLPGGRGGRVVVSHSGGVKAVAFAPDGRTLASASLDKTIKLWDVTTEQELVTLTGHTDEVNAVAFSPDGKVLASAGHDGTVRFWRASEDPRP